MGRGFLERAGCNNQNRTQNTRSSLEHRASRGAGVKRGLRWEVDVNFCVYGQKGSLDLKWQCI